MRSNIKLAGLSLTAVLYALLPSAHGDTFNYEEEYFNQSAAPQLSKKDQANLKRLQQWEQSAVHSMQGAFIKSDGTITFTYGAQTPALVCSALQITDLELDTGEIINSINIGDASRWAVETAVSGSGAQAVQHVLIKPLDTGLKTTMMIATDQRAYRLFLRSVYNAPFYSHVAFTYPEKINAQLKAQQAALQRERERNSIPTESADGPKTYLGDLNFNYKISGDVSWKPVRVFDDGKKTIIEMPDAMLYQKAPSLILLLQEGGLFTDEKTEIINYRLQGSRYVVDGIFDRALLTMGIDEDEQRVLIERQVK